jgi:hypothetical protein
VKFFFSVSPWAKTVTVIIDEQGNAQIETSGFKGQACEKFTAALEKSLGVISGNRRRKPEFFQGQSNTASNTAKAGQG